MSTTLIPPPPHQHRSPAGPAFLAGIRDTVAPGRSGPHGPLPPVLVSMTLVTGLVDAFSCLVLGHVFVANMTGNIVFLGFALAGAPGFSITASLAAVAAFALGALLGGRLAARHRDHRARLHSSAAVAQAVFVAVAVILAIASGGAPAAGYRYALIAALGVAMGIQNASARSIAVPDLTTTVLTLTITGVAADSALAGGSGSRIGRRLVSIIAMLGGALLGATLIRHAQAYDPLAIALAMVIAGAAVSHLLGRSDPAWVRSQRQGAPVPNSSVPNRPVPDKTAPSPATATEAQMSVERSHAAHQTRYELRDETGLSCVLTYTADPDEPATWKILLPGPGGTEDLYGTQRFATPDAAQLRSWLSPVVGSSHAAELAAAVEAAPPQPAAWRPQRDAG
jgi:uncharacterized membrane protein YoaK (UPF0700 family)